MSPHIDACDACLWRTELVAALAGRLEIRWRRGTVVRTAVLTLPDEDLIALDGGDATALANALAPDRARHRLLDRGLGAVCRHAAAYPPALHELPDPPAVLHIAGDPAALAPPLGLALVGARRGTPYGIEVARTLGRGVAEAGVPVVSGLALGVDAAAHAGALSGSAPLVGVLAGGADLAYPANSRRLRERVIQRGCVVSELPPGFTARRWCFVARNRIIAALAGATVVVEAAERSGSLTTADFAAGLGRPVGAVPGPVTHAFSVGGNGLLAAGAAVIRDAVDAIGLLPYPTARRPVLRAQDRLDATLAGLLTEIERGHGTLAELATGGAAPAQVLTALTELELRGLVRRDFGGRYVRALA